MDVVVCGAQALYTRGGAELNLENLVAAFQAAGHRTDLVRVPVAWEKGRLFDAPMAWRLLPIDADLVVAMNFPSYFVRHPNKVVWLNHQHRGAYELADQPWSDIGYDPVSLEIQRQLAEWDTRALSEARRIFTVSGVVAERLARFNGLTGVPLYHPPPLADRLRPGAFGDYVLLPSRLAENKRPRLLVESAAELTSDTRVVLAGEGPQRAELQSLIERLGCENRVSMLGHVSDEELVDLIAESLAVVYPPYDEDYGYVTLQAFVAGKPVLTCIDSGGVLEWVIDGETGVVTDPDPGALAKGIDRLAGDRAWAAMLGARGRERVSKLSWGPVVDALVKAGAS